MSAAQLHHVLWAVHVCVEKRVFVRYLMSCAIIWYKMQRVVGFWVDWQFACSNHR